MKHPILQAALIGALIAASADALAATVYVTDKLSVSLRTGDSTQHKIVKMLMSGTPLTVVKQKPDTGYTLVRTQNGQEGWVLSRFLVEAPGARAQLEKALQELAAAQDELARIKGGGVPNAAPGEPGTQQDALIQERDRLARELNELRRTAANAIQLKEQRDKLQERVVMVERELHQVKREKQTLEDSTNQDWFLYGGLLGFSGIFLGLIIPKLGWRRKSGSWDTF